MAGPALLHEELLADVRVAAGDVPDGAAAGRDGHDDSEESDDCDPHEMVSSGPIGRRPAGSSRSLATLFRGRSDNRPRAVQPLVVVVLAFACAASVFSAWRAAGACESLGASRRNAV